MSGPGASNRSGTVLGGRYHLGRLLGEGGAGAVYEATPVERPLERYAVKVLHEELAISPTVVERFLAEGDVCRRLDHPGILRVFDVGRDGGVPYLVMELLEGRSLADYTDSGQRLPLNFAVTVCAGVLHALDYAHARGIVHRDLKPENVFLCPGAGGQWQTKLLDFGIARAIDAAGGARRRTATGVLLGTPGYMSPEQVKAARSVDHRTDLWAVGVMFYEMVSGAQAFPAEGADPDNVWGMISAVLTREPAPLGAFDPHLAPFEAFSRRALSKELDGRYASAREMSDDLLRIARGEAPVTIAVAANATSAVAADATSDVAAQHGAFTREQRLVPVNSRGELPRIPAVDPSASPASAEWSAPPAPQAVGTMPSGVQRQALDALSGTVPMSPRGGFEPQAMPGAGTMLAPQSPPLASPSRAAEAAPAPHVPKHATSPSGFQPSAPYVPSAPSPLESARGQDDGDGAGGPLPWILLGVALLGALVAAVVWALA